MANSAKDTLIMEYKDTIRQLNTTIAAQSEIIVSLKEMLSVGDAAAAKLQEQLAYLTRRLFGTSSEKCNDLAGQLSLFMRRNRLPPHLLWICPKKKQRFMNISVKPKVRVINLQRSTR